MKILKNRKAIMFAMVVLIFFGLVYVGRNKQEYESKVESNLSKAAAFLGFKGNGNGNFEYFDDSIEKEYERWSKYGCSILYQDANTKPPSDTLLDDIFDSLTTETVTGGREISKTAYHTDIVMHKTHKHGIFHAEIAENFRGCTYENCKYVYDEKEKVAALCILLYGSDTCDEIEFDIYNEISDIPMDLLIASMKAIDGQMNALDGKTPTISTVLGIWTIDYL